MPLRTLLVDDESHSLELLQIALEEYCPEVEIIGAFTSPLEARKAILNQQPDLLILDIQMPGLNGFELLESLQPVNFVVIFSTAFDQFAIEALRVAAIDYLLKPLDEAALVKAIARVQTRNILPDYTKLKIKPEPEERNTNATIALPSSEGMEFVPINTILYCQSDSNYCRLILENGNRILVSKPLKEIASKLPSSTFFRVHHSYLVNLSKIKRYLRGSGGVLEMLNGDQVKVARSKKEDLLARF